MVVAREPLSSRLGLVLFILLLWACGADEMSNVPPSGRPRAEALVAAYAAHVGAPERALDSQDKASFGTVSFRYLPADDALTIRIYVNAAMLEGAPPEELENYRKIVPYLNDPEVGGMYERGGGHFVLDEDSQAYLLVKDIAVAELNPRTLFREIDYLQEVSAHWTTGWLGEVAMIMHGHRTKPTQRVSIPSGPSD